MGKDKYIRSSEANSDSYSFQESNRNTEFESSHKGIQRQFQINKSLIDSSEYRKRFNLLGEKPNITRAIYSASKLILNHRNGTEFEDLVFINSDTGETLISNHENKVRSVSPTRKMRQMLSDSASRTIIAIHNHPGSSVPSYADLNIALIRKYKFGLIVGHDGIIFKYLVNNLVDEGIYNAALAKLDGKGYNTSTLTVFSKTLYSLGVSLEVLQ